MGYQIIADQIPVTGVVDSSRSLCLPIKIGIRWLPLQQPGDAGPGGEYPGLFERPDYPSAPIAQIPQPEDLSESPLRYASWPSRCFPRLYHRHLGKHIPKRSSPVTP